MRLDHLLSKENYLLFNFEGSFLKISTLSNGIFSERIDVGDVR